MYIYMAISVDECIATANLALTSVPVTLPQSTRQAMCSHTKLATMPSSIINAGLHRPDGEYAITGYYTVQFKSTSMTFTTDTLYIKMLMFNGRERSISVTTKICRI